MYSATGSHHLDTLASGERKHEQTIPGTGTVAKVFIIYHSTLALPSMRLLLLLPLLLWAGEPMNEVDRLLEYQKLCYVWPAVDYVRAAPVCHCSSFFEMLSSFAQHHCQYLMHVVWHWPRRSTVTDAAATIAAAAPSPHAPWPHPDRGSDEPHCWVAMPWPMSTEEESRQLHRLVFLPATMPLDPFAVVPNVLLLLHLSLCGTGGGGS